MYAHTHRYNNLGKAGNKHNIYFFPSGRASGERRTYPLCLSFVVVKIHTASNVSCSNYFQGPSTVTFSTFTAVCDHNFCLTPGHCLPPKETPIFMKNHFLFHVTPSPWLPLTLLYISMNLPLLLIS